MPLYVGVLQLADFVKDQSGHPDVLLRKTKLFDEDLSCPTTLLSAEHVAQIYRNAWGLLSQQDLPLMLGQQLLPSSLAQLSTGLIHAPTMQHALDFLLLTQSHWSPLLQLSVFSSVQSLHLYFQDRSGAALSPAEVGSISISLMEALRTFMGWFGDPNTISEWQYTVAGVSETEWFECQNRWLGSDIIAGAIPCISFPKTHLSQSLSQGVASVYHLSYEQALTLPASFLGLIQSRLLSQIKQVPTLHEMAEQLALSPATFKRKLKAHHTSYQKQVDLVRQLVSHHYSTQLSYSDEQIADLLCFYDRSNFRRAMKRWMFVS